MNIEYHSSFPVQHTWELPRKDGRRVTCGFWMRETIDKIVPPKIQRTDHDYQYTSLSGIAPIRLFRLSPGPWKDYIHGTFIQVDLSDSSTIPAYEALSYCWGSGFNGFKLGDLLVGDWEGSLRITQSLELVLRHLRSETEERVLWIDQVCIDQFDTVEKTDQVGRMMEIYSRAESVVVWLGAEAYENPVVSAIGMECLAGWVDLGETGDAEDVPVWQKLTPKVVEEGLRDVLERPWFKRLWVVQEAAVARNVQMICGSHSFKWSTKWQQVRSFSRAIKAAVISPEWTAAGLKEVDTDQLLRLLDLQLTSGPDRETARKNASPPDLLDVSYEMRHRECSDPRDRLYALMGLVDPEQRLIPDYSQPVALIYEHVLKMLSQETREPDRDESQLGQAKAVPQDDTTSSTWKTFPSKPPKKSRGPYRGAALMPILD